MIQHVMRPKVPRPVPGFGARGGGDHGEVSALPRDLHGDGADPARAADDHDGLRRAGHGAGHVHPIEHRLPCGERGQRQGCGFRPAERGGAMTDDAFIHQMQFGIGAGTDQRSGIKHLVARLEQRHLRPGGAHDPGGIPADHFPRAALGRGAAADLVIDRVHRHRPDLDQQIAPFGPGVRQVDVDQRCGFGNGAGDLVSNSFHGMSPACMPQT